MLNNSPILIKYPRTFHLPWSPGISNDDKVMKDLNILENSDVVVTLKMDGENTTLGRNFNHARSLDSDNHSSRDWVKNFHSIIKHNIPKNWRVCGENLYAEHSIHYGELPSYFMGFSIWNENNICLSWKETIEWFNLLGVTPVPVIYEGTFDKDKIQHIFDTENINHEGYVVRVSGEIQYDEFGTHVGKWVRENHVTSVDHWRVSWKRNTLIGMEP